MRCCQGDQQLAAVPPEPRVAGTDPVADSAQGVVVGTAAEVLTVSAAGDWE